MYTCTFDRRFPLLFAPPFELLRHKRPIGTLEAQVRVLLRASIETYDARRFLLLRVDVDAVGLEAAA